MRPVTRLRWSCCCGLLLLLCCVRFGATRRCSQSNKLQTPHLSEAPEPKQVFSGEAWQCVIRALVGFCSMGLFSPICPLTTDKPLGSRFFTFTAGCLGVVPTHVFLVTLSSLVNCCGGCSRGTTYSLGGAEIRAIFHPNPPCSPLTQHGLLQRISLVFATS